MRKSARGRPIYSLERLLGAQGPGIRKDPRFAELESMLRGSARLRAARLNRRAYALLDEPRLELRNLANFIDTYRVPDSPFFKLFLSIKWDRRASLAGARRDREARIAAIATGFPPGARGLIDYLEAAERRSNSAAPLWREELRPGTLKRAREMAAFGASEWIDFLEDYIERLRGSYRRIALADTETLVACMVLECRPDPVTGRLPSKAAIRAQFKRLSKSCHPDLGGDARRFLVISRARDELLR